MLIILHFDRRIYITARAPSEQHENKLAYKHYRGGLIVGRTMPIYFNICVSKRDRNLGTRFQGNKTTISLIKAENKSNEHSARENLSTTNKNISNLNDLVHNT